MKVKDCMCNDVCCASPSTTVNDVAKMMAKYHIGSVPICDENDCICGIVTDRDILLRSLCCQKDAKTTPISEIMTCNVCTCGEDDEISNVESKMSENQIRRIPVCDTNNKVVGILTIGDLMENDSKIGIESFCTTFENICNCKSNKTAE